VIPLIEQRNRVAGKGTENRAAHREVAHERGNPGTNLGIIGGGRKLPRKKAWPLEFLSSEKTTVAKGDHSLDTLRGGRQRVGGRQAGEAATYLGGKRRRAWGRSGQATFYFPGSREKGGGGTELKNVVDPKREAGRTLGSGQGQRQLEKCVVRVKKKSPSLWSMCKRYGTHSKR